jgi:hypothetical protein
MIVQVQYDIPFEGVFIEDFPDLDSAIKHCLYFKRPLEDISILKVEYLDVYREVKAYKDKYNV